MTDLIESFDQLVRARRSVRGFVPDRAVPRGLLEEAFALAQQAPSNCNVQPWRVFVALGERCRHLRARLLQAAAASELSERAGASHFEGDYRARQVDCARRLYQCMEIERHDVQGRQRAAWRNYAFFDAPHVAILCMHESFGAPVALDVGVYLQTLMLALKARGVDSCAQGSLRSGAEVLRQELGIGPELQILCGLSFGYEDPAVPANQTRQTREPVARNVVFVE